MNPKRYTLEEAFWRKVEKTDYCWLWHGTLNDFGYGRLYYTPIPGKRGITLKAHRASVIIHGIEIPKGMHVLHKCDNPKCVNPDHLYIGTNADNMRDKSERGRCVNQNTHKTHCKNGHEFSAENMYISPDGYRICKICFKAYYKNREILKSLPPQVKG